MKKKIAIGLFILSLVFYGGYSLGVHTNTRWTMEYMLNLEKFHLADRAAMAIIEFKEMKSNAKDDKTLICKMRQSVIRYSEDWDNCKLTSNCAKEAKGLTEGFYSQVDRIVLEFKAISCE
jgi:hypothetical protein